MTPHIFECAKMNTTIIHSIMCLLCGVFFVNLGKHYFLVFIYVNIYVCVFKYMYMYP